MQTSQYFIKRGIPKDILEKYKVYDCWEKKDEMYCRAVVPVFDSNNKIVGCIGRRVYDNPKYDKWKCQHGFKRGSYLYNQHNAQLSGTIVLVEGPKEVWLGVAQGVSNIVATMSNTISSNQADLLRYSISCGTLKQVLVLGDNDVAGFEMYNNVCAAMKDDVIQIKRIQSFDEANNAPREMSVESIAEILNERFNYSIWATALLKGFNHPRFEYVRYTDMINETTNKIVDSGLPVSEVWEKVLRSKTEFDIEGILFFPSVPTVKPNKFSKKIYDVRELVKHGEKLLDVLGIEYTKRGEKLLCRCPIHNGDSKDSCIIDLSGYGKWICNTRSCSRVDNRFFSFILLLLQRNYPNYIFKDALKWARKVLEDFTPITL